MTLNFKNYNQLNPSQPIDEQMRVLERARARMREAIKLINKRLEKPEELK